MPGKTLLFVVQQHHATHMHWDFRLEMDGVLVSWAVPKGPSIRPSEKRLAIRVEDHVYGYKDFEGVIPGNDYGSGKVIIWDRGEYKPKDVDPECNLHDKWLSGGVLEFTLYGSKLKGDWVLVKTKKRLYGEDSWLLIKKNDSYAGSGNIVEMCPNSVLSGKTVDQINEEDGLFDPKNYEKSIPDSG